MVRVILALVLLLHYVSYNTMHSGALSPLQYFYLYSFNLHKGMYATFHEKIGFNHPWCQRREGLMWLGCFFLAKHLFYVQTPIRGFQRRPSWWHACVLYYRIYYHGDLTMIHLWHHEIYCWLSWGQFPCQFKRLICNFLNGLMSTATKGCPRFSMHYGDTVHTCVAAVHSFLATHCLIGNCFTFQRS